MMLNGYITKIGAFLLAIEGALLASGMTYDPYVQATLAFLGLFLTIFGFRRAIDKKK
jgi:hypothetical protein